MSSINNQDSQLIIQSLSNLELSSDIFNSQETQNMFRDMKTAMDNAKTSADKARLAKQAVENGNFFGNWWHNRKDVLRDAQHDLSLAVADLSENNSKLLIFNTAISKMLLDAQNKLNEQQITLNNQAQELKLHTKELANQNENLNKTNKKIIQEQERLDSLIEEFIQIKGLTREQVGQIAQIVKDANILKDELTQNFRKECNGLSQSLAIAEMGLSSKYDEIKNDFNNLDKNIDEISLLIKEMNDSIDNNKNEQDNNISKTKDLLMENIQFLDKKNKELQENFNSNKSSFSFEIDKVNKELEDAKLSLKNNKQEISDELNNQQKTMAEKEKEIYGKMLKIEKYLINEIGLLDYNTRDKIDNQKTVIMDSVIELSNFVNNSNQNIKAEFDSFSDNVHSNFTKIERKFLNESKIVKQLVDSSKGDFENELIAIQDHFYDEINKLKKICLVLFILLVSVFIGFGAYLYFL